jgi:GTP-binding protein
MFTFVSSVANVKDCPTEHFPEFALIGRSNVGKSSLVNMLAGRKKLALTSSTPGKTRTINHYLNANQWFLVDLPGYGYAKASKSSRAEWHSFIADYLRNRNTLCLVFILVDARLRLQKNDRDMMEFFGLNHIPFRIIFTKCDKLGTNALNKQISNLLSDIGTLFDPLPDHFLSSASSNIGKNEILSYIENCLKHL